MKNEKAMTTNPSYLELGTFEVEYEPNYSVTGLSWFNIAQCARKRMTERCGNIHQWRGERRSFYTALRMMEVDEIVFND